MREISKKVSDIQNGSLAEFKIRELNDSINELIQAKDQWEARILSLGGRDYKADALEKFGNEVNFNSTGEYQYFGAAKTLVVEELTTKPEEHLKSLNSKQEILARLDKEYFQGKQDELELLEIEMKAEAELITPAAA